MGHRTIVANPTDPNTLELLNSLVKYREKVRPLAPMMTLKAAKKYFHLKEGASDDDYVAYNFMILAAKAKEGVDKLVPAIVHADNSSRLQVVRENNDLFVHSYLKSMGKYTGVEISVNTSLNVGTPIVQTPTQALHALRKSKGMHGLIFISRQNIYLVWDACTAKKLKLKEQMKRNKDLKKFNHIVQLNIYDILKEWEIKSKVTLKKEIIF